MSWLNKDAIKARSLALVSPASEAAPVSANDGIPGIKTAKPLKVCVSDGAPEISAWHKKKRANMRSMLVRLFAFTFVPTLVAAIYFGFIVTDRYVSEFQLMVNTPDSGVMSMFSSILGGGGGSGMNQENYVIERYIQSHAALSKLDELLDLRAHFSQDTVDAFSRLDPNASNENFLSYYLSRIKVANDPTSQIIEVQVQAFSPDMAKAIADLLIVLCDDLVNEFNDEARRDTLAFAESEFARSEQQLRDVRKQTSEFRNREGELNPVDSVTMITAIISSLEAQIVEKRVELARSSSYMQPNSVRITALRDDLSALTTQLDIERKRLVNVKGGSVDQPLYGKLLSEYESLLIEETLAQTNYMNTSKAYQLARANADKQNYVYLVAFSPPTLPDEALEPKRLYSILMVFLGVFVAYLLGSFTWAAVREHVGT